MRRPVRLACAAVAVVLATSGVAHATAIANPLITLNESGVGTLLFPGGAPIPTTGVMKADPGPGGLTSALTYDLLGPPALVAGDLVLFEPGTTGVISDIIRFNPAGTGSAGYPASVVFYSDNLDGVDALADTGFPVSLYTNVLFLTETGLEGGPNGILYTPTAGQPGFVAGFEVSYAIESDAAPVPEPATLLLAGSGLLAAYRARRRLVG